MRKTSRQAEGEAGESHRVRAKARRGGGRLLVGAALAASLVAGRADGHPQYSSTLSNRYLKLSLVGGGALRIAYTTMIGEAPAAAARRQADANGDGIVDEGEQHRFADRLAAAIAEGLEIDVDGKRATPAWEPAVPGFGSDRRVGAIPFSIDLVGRVAVPGRGPHVVRVDDATVIDALGESEVRIEEGPGTRVLAAWQGREDGQRVMRFVWNGPKFSVLEDRSVGFRFVDEGGGPGVARRRGPSPIALLAALLGVAAAAFALVRLRRR